MKFIGKDIYIQRGENWTLDFDAVNEKGDPLMLLKNWNNPYLAITVTAARYEQEGDFRATYWLDLKRRYVEQSDGSLVVQSMKTFISTEALYIPLFSIDEVIGLYGVDAGGKVVLDEHSDFDITNFLFVCDVYGDGNKTYRYVKEYTLDPDTGEITNEVWEDYNFRIIKQFDTRLWVEQGYLYDIKILAGETLQEYILAQLDAEGTSYDYTSDEIWNNTVTQHLINLIKDEQKREYAQKVFDEGMPLMPSYDTKNLILDPSNLYVSANIQGGIK